MGGEGSGVPKCDLLILDGTKLTDGKLEKTDFFGFLQTDLSDYSHIKMTPKQALSFKNTLIRMKHGVMTAMPMICGGKKCINKLCVFHEEENWPLAQQCVYEVRLIQALTVSYMDDIGIDPDSTTEMALLNKLIECDLIDYRANLSLSGAIDEEAATLLKTQVVDTGKFTFETLNVHPLIEVKDKTHKSRMQILESLAVTRREKYKKASALGKSEDSDASSFLADLKDMFEDKAPPLQQKTSLDKIKEDAKKVSEDLIYDADWSSDE